jgi:hypothetical protein
MAIIPSRKLLISTSSQLLVYDLPNFESLGSASRVATPVWEHECDKAYPMYQHLFHVIHPTPGAYPQGLVVIWAEKLVMTLTLTGPSGRLSP